MNLYVPRPGENLPTYQAARERIEQLAAVDGAAIDGPESLADHLAGVAPALGSISISHGTVVAGHNDGLLHRSTNGGNPSVFTVMHNNVFQASMREAVYGPSDPSHSHPPVRVIQAEVPSDTQLAQLFAQPRSDWHDGNPDSKLFSAARIAGGQRVEYFPFLTREFHPNPSEVCLPDSLGPYFDIVRLLSRRLLDITATMSQPVS